MLDPTTLHILLALIGVVTFVFTVVSFALSWRQTRENFKLAQLTKQSALLVEIESLHAARLGVVEATCTQLRADLALLQALVIRYEAELAGYRRAAG